MYKPFIFRKHISLFTETQLFRIHSGTLLEQFDCQTTSNEEEFYLENRNIKNTQHQEEQFQLEECFISNQ